MSSRLAPPEVLSLNAREWLTPLTGIEAEHGEARLKRDTYAKGIYRMEGIGGYEYFHVRGPGRMPVTALQRREPTGQWKTWMVDDPLHWIGMRERVMDLPAGRLLVAGLGLGLFAHHLMERPDITQIDVVEIDADVIALIEPTLPDDPRRELVHDDFYRYIAEPIIGLGIDPVDPAWRAEQEAHPRYDAVLWDLAVGGVDETRGDFLTSLAEVLTWLPGATLSQFGLRNNERTILG